MSDIEKLRSHLASRPRDLLLLEIALQTSVPVQEILALNFDDLRDLQVGEELPARLRKPEGAIPVMTAEIRNVLNRLMQEGRLEAAEDYLFQSRKGNGPLSPQSVSRLIRSWQESAGIQKISGLPGLRQSFRQAQTGLVERVERSMSVQEGENVEEVQGGITGENATQSSPTPYLAKVRTKTVQETVYDELETAILSGRIIPGQKLVTEEIARMMDVSRIPVREAMGRLAARGLIATRPKAGSVVRELSRENLEEISEIRLLLEPKAAAKAVANTSESFTTQLRQAQEIFARVRKTTNTRQLLESNRHFHFLIYGQADSPELLNLIKQLWDKVSPYYHIMFGQSLERSPTVGVSYHEKIVEAFVARNADGVCRWLSADIVDSTGYILNLFDTFKKQDADGFAS